MSVNIGIVGLSKSGKTTIFNGLTKGKAATGGYSKKDQANIGMAAVPDQRVHQLAEIFHPKKKVFAEVKYIDIGASVKEMATDKGIGGQLLNQLSTVDLLLNVVRAFKEDSLPHPEGSLNVARDMEAMNLELAFSDLAILEKRLEKMENSLKSAKQVERAAIQKEQELLQKIKADLEKDIPIREMPLTPDELKSLGNYQFLTAKPLLHVVNLGEDQLPEAGELEEKWNKIFAKPKARVIASCGKLEMELSQMEDDAMQEFRQELGMTESGLDRTIRVSYELLDYISFLTVGDDECRAWPIRRGTEAVRAAGKVHTDIERGFIRAEVIHYIDLLRVGGLVEAKKQGLLRLEGKNYIVQDGDCINYLFNV
ncbi:MAG TPA: redox-regulated ATPase YchF [Dehalococcoidales bacterium]|nr:redox-regulated ATPase YchF [Dehalococcoidales bacterium]